MPTINGYIFGLTLMFLINTVFELKLNFSIPIFIISFCIALYIDLFL